MAGRVHQRDFDPADLAARAAQQGQRVSVCLPAYDEAATIGAIVTTIREELVERVGLVDELIVVDDGSTDATAAVAADAGATVVASSEVLAEELGGSGKGNTLWKSLFVSTGDIVCWVDADLRDFPAHFVTGLVGPLVLDESISFTKGFYRRPLDDDPTGGGRVTELVVRPLLSQFFPELASIVQPIGGEYAGRRSLLERIPFVEGWGVDIGMLIDVWREVGLDGIAQVDLELREHRNRPLGDLGPPALAVLVTVLRRAGLAPDDEIAALRRFDPSGVEEVVHVEVRERPPMATIDAYRTRLSGELRT